MNFEGLLKENMMGPNCIKLAEELTKDIDLKPGMRVLDLGCGKGLTSLYLADRFDVQVFAVDLWITATENYRRFKEAGLEESIIPIHADAVNLPFAASYFDAAISVDAYHYFGMDETYMHMHLADLVKPGGTIAIVVPGLKQDIHQSIPPEMLLSWSAEDIDTLQTLDWWENILNQCSEIEKVSVKEMRCFEESWRDWLSCDNPYALSDRAAMRAGAGQYMNIISAIYKKKSL